MWQDGEFKLPPVVAFDAVEIRERDWCNVVTCHMDESVAYTWSLQNFVIGEHVLKPSPDNPAPVKVCYQLFCCFMQWHFSTYNYLVVTRPGSEHPSSPC
jgi:hypothetical protein